MENMKCAGCSMELHPADVVCSKCDATMDCSSENCSCTCGNSFPKNEVKCKTCLGK